MCSDPIIGKSICHGISGAISGSLDQIAQEFQQAEVQVVRYLVAWWVNWPSRTPTMDQNGNVYGPTGFIMSHTAWLVGLVAVFGLLVAAGRIAWERRGDTARQAMGGLLTLVVVTGCAVAVVQLATQAGDSYSNWIINQALDPHVVNGDKIDQAAFLKQFSALASMQNTAMSSGLVLLLAIFAIVSMLVQLVMMVARIAMVALLTGFLPLGAALSGTTDGRAWWKKMQGWLLAFVLYKPVAATIYAFALAGLNTVGTDATTKDDAGTAQLVGIVTIILAVLALPALMRFITPMVSATTTGPGGSAAAAVAGAALATGARMLGGANSSGGNGSGGGGGSTSSPQGATTPGSPNRGDGGASGGASGNQPKTPSGTGGNGTAPANGGGPSGGAGTGGGPSGAPSGGTGGGGGGAAGHIAGEAAKRFARHSQNAANEIRTSTLDEGDGPRGSR